MVEFAKFFLTFATAESCGKCVPAARRQRMLEILSRICAEKAATRTSPRSAKSPKHGKRRPLRPGQLTRPVMAALRYFENESCPHRGQTLPGRLLQGTGAGALLNACPAGVTSAYVSLAAEGRFAEALAVHRERNPFAMICGRVCPLSANSAAAGRHRRSRRHPLDQTVMPIMKRPSRGLPQNNPVGSKRKGGGSVGPRLTAALRLAKRVSGDGLRGPAVPAHDGRWDPRIPLAGDVLNAKSTTSAGGVEIVCNRALAGTLLGGSFRSRGLQGRDHRHRAIAACTWESGRGAAGVINGTDFLREAALGGPRR